MATSTYAHAESEDEPFAVWVSNRTEYSVLSFDFAHDHVAFFLTPKRLKEIHQAIGEFLIDIEADRVAPTVREIAADMGLSAATIQQHLNILKANEDRS